MSAPKGNGADVSSAPSGLGVSEHGQQQGGGVLFGMPRPRVATLEDERAAVHRIVAAYLAEAPVWALTRQEAASRLGVSVEFFEQYVAPEVRCIRRGRRLLFPAGEILLWLWRAAD